VAVIPLLVLAQRMPGVFHAHAILVAEPPHLRWAVEARLLAGESFDSIAQKCRTTAEAIHWYEKLFFSVRDSLHCSSWVMCVVLEGKMYRLTEPDPETLWRFYGYWGGPYVLDSLIGEIGNAPWPESAEQVKTFLEEDTRALLIRKLAIAARLVPAEMKNIPTLLALSDRLLALDRSAQTDVAAAGANTSITTALEILETLTLGDQGRPEAGEAPVSGDLVPEPWLRPGIPVPEAVMQRTTIVPVETEAATS
jgi:hypothetical protein